MRLTTLPLVFLLGTLLLPPAARAQEIKTRYFLPKSAVTLTATVTTKNTFPAAPAEGMIADGSVETSNVSVTLATVPDPKWPLSLTSEAALLAKNTVSIESGATGLLTSVNLKSEGVLGSIVKNIFGAVVSLAKAASGLRLTALTDPEKKYLQDQKVRAERRAQLKDYIDRATTQIIDLEKEIINSKRGTDIKPLRIRIDELEESLSSLRAELLLADAHFSAWKANLEQARETRVEHVQDADDLPDDKATRDLADSDSDTILIDEVIKAACTFDRVLKPKCAFGEVVRQTRVIVTQEGLEVEPDVKPEIKAGGQSPAVFYRGLRPVKLSVYLLNSQNKPVRSKQTTEFVTGWRSPVLSLALYNSKWSTKSVGVTFTNGAITKLTSELGSEAAGAAEAFRALPAEYLAAVKQANEIIGEDSKNRLATVQAQIDDLKKQKELVEARVASGESGDLAATQAQTARLEAELKLLNTQRTMAGAQGQGAGDTAVALQILKLQNELADAQVKQMQLQQQLDELRKKAGGAQ